jgi:hypothetical protein
MWDLWWTKWHWDKFSPEYFGFPLSISFHRCSITRKNEKKLFIFITGLHNKPQGYGMPVASAAGPFTTKKKEKNTYCYLAHKFTTSLIYFNIVLSSNIGVGCRYCKASFAVQF